MNQPHHAWVQLGLRLLVYEALSYYQLQVYEALNYYQLQVYEALSYYLGEPAASRVGPASAAGDACSQLRRNVE